MPKTLSEHERAKQWRQALGLTIAQVAAKTGFHASSIADFETGIQRKTGKPVDPKAMQRYRMACAAIDAGAELFNFT